MKPRLNHLIHKSTVIVILIERFLLWNWSRILILTYSSLKSSILHVSWHFFMEFWISLMDSPVIFYTINMSVIRIYNFLVWIEYVSLRHTGLWSIGRWYLSQIYEKFKRGSKFLCLMDKHICCMYGTILYISSSYLRDLLLIN